MAGMLSANRVWRLALLAVLLPLAACTVTVDPDDDGDGDGGGAQTVRVRIINNSNVTLDPELFVAANPVGVAELFADPNKYTAFGVGTLGLVEAGGTYSFELDCAATRVIGTKGGRFGNNLNTPDGTGQQRVLTQELNFLCGEQIVLTYNRSGSSFTTTFDVNP